MLELTNEGACFARNDMWKIFRILLGYNPKELMRNSKIRCILLVLLFGVCSISLASEERVKQLLWLEDANPIVDAQKAINNNDYKFKAVYGYMLIIPGVEPEKQKPIADQYGVSPIEGTSDDISGDDHARLINLAYKYAETYNKILLDKLGQKAGL